MKLKAETGQMDRWASLRQSVLDAIPLMSFFFGVFFSFAVFSGMRNIFIPQLEKSSPGALMTLFIMLFMAIMSLSAGFLGAICFQGVMRDGIIEHGLPKK